MDGENGMWIGVSVEAGTRERVGAVVGGWIHGMMIQGEAALAVQMCQRTQAEATVVIIVSCRVCPD